MSTDLVSPPPARRSAGVAVFLSFLLPGAGQLYVSRWLAGTLFLLGWLIGVVLTVVTFGVLFLVPMLVWIAAMIHAARAADRR
jgi:TM2 domain-containing membrane protein YozV